ncbi:hypothetical protein CASFOL_014698 [Castilleja foliolosa]|uniref:Leucine-rich repeat-containing N-terminal plant-type domain-containing protein n=1 Tax=Castilleja foliolosa TaxID=1961234 RepID=A0ABD3DFV8_9LAMI
MKMQKKKESIMKKLAANYLFFILFISSKLGYICIACPEIEQKSLLIFKQSLQDPSNLLSSWKNETDCCNWKGIVCSNLTGHIHQLNLQNYDSSLQGLSGEISPSLLNLKHLEYLDLSQNQFQQTIPSFIGSLTRLEYLNLSNAGFHGKIPHTIGNLSNLRTLVLEAETAFESSLNVDSLEWLSGLSRLEHLNMNLVRLGKTRNWLEQVTYKLPSLVELRLSQCNLNSDIIVNNNNISSTNSKLAILDLSSNNLQSYDILRLIFQLSNLIFLDLSINNFDGPVPSISNTTKLKHIDLSVNSFNSSIPEWIYFCKDLEFLSFSGNRLQNELSESIANLTSLKSFDLSFNQFSGKIPRQISNLCRLQKLYLSSNKLNGDVSDSFGNMSGCFLGSLEYLSLSTNQLSGHLTRQFGEFTSLYTLDVSANSLSGEIPTNIGNLSSSLEYLYLVDNKLTGKVPESVGRLSNMIEFGISDNMLEGVMTERHFEHLSELKYLYISRINQLSLNVSTNWTPPFELETLRMGSLNLGSGFKIPLWLETQRKTIFELDLSCTGISGNVPKWIWNIRSLNLSHNKLHGKIPFLDDPVDDYYGTYRLIYLSSNNFTGSLPRVANIVTELDLANNSFSGDVSRFLCDTTTNEANMIMLNLAGNRLFGEFPDCWTNWPMLRMLNLGYNNLSGTIPNSIGYLTSLESLNLVGNKFSGRIPFQLRNCTSLLKIDLSSNNLDGNVPTWIGTSLYRLKFLILRSNKFSGEITSTICQLSSLQILDLSDNRLSGTIPSCVDNFTAMSTKAINQGSTAGYSFYESTVMESASVETKGSELEYDTILPLVTLIDLSNNRLSGYIPDELSSLLELRSLNLSRNRLTGPIPDSIGNMKQLESLDFSINSLSGKIPSSFGTMSSLSYLNLSCNNMTGKIPDTTQLRGFNKSSFIGNDLCGPPLTNSCGDDDRITPESMHEEDEGDDKPEIEWLYVFVYLGYLFGLSPFILILKRTWRHAYYEFLEDMWDIVYVYFVVIWRRQLCN